MQTAFIETAAKVTYGKAGGVPCPCARTAESLIRGRLLFEGVFF